MAISKLDNKIEETLASAIVEKEVFEPAQDIPAEPEVDITQVADTPFVEEVAAPVEDPTEEPEPIQVAGLGSLSAKLAERVAKAEKKVLPKLPDEPIQQVGSSLVIRQATLEEFEAVNNALGGEYTKGINFPQIAENMGEVDLGDYLARLKDANQELFENARRGTINFDSLLKMAEQQGADDVIMDWAQRVPGSGEAAETVLAGLLAARELSFQTGKTLKRARAMPVGEARDKEYMRFMQMMTLEFQVYANLSGAGSEAARTMYMLRQAQKQLQLGEAGSRADAMAKMFGAENAQDIEYLGEMYMALPTPAAKATFVKQGIGAKSMDVTAEVFLSSILNSPVTHTVNILGNSIFMATRQAETMAASAIGLARGTAFRTNDRVRISEGFAQLEGMRESLMDAILVAGKTLLTEEPSDLVTKIDIRNRRAIGTTGDPREVVKMIREGNMMAAAVNTYGIMTRMGGRFLLAEDEFFKAIAYRSALRRMSRERMNDAYYSAIDAGKTAEEAKQLSVAEGARVLNDPPQNVIQDAQDISRQLTFQGDLDGWLGDIQGGMAHPIAKLFMPFYKTPMNVMKETLKRTPAAMAHPEFWRRIKSGGRDADMAISEVAVTSSIMAAFSYAAMGLDTPDENVIIVGSGPSDYKARQAMARRGMQPSSINIKQEDGTYKSITFSRLDPISGALNMAADFAYYAQYEDDPQVLDNLAKAATLGLAQYGMNMPMLQTGQELTAIFRSPNPEDSVERLMELMGSKVTQAGLAFIPGVSSFTAGVERQIDPGMSSTMLPESGVFSGLEPTEMPSFMRGFYMELERAKGRNPFFSDQVEPRLNLWGEQMTAGTGAGWEFWSPIRVQDTKYSPVDEELMALGGGITRNPRKIDGVLLNAKQYNKWITTMNTMDLSGRFPDDPNYDFGQTLLPNLVSMIKDEEYLSQRTKDKKLEMINARVGMFRSAARDMLLKEDAYLNKKVNAVQ